MLKNNKKIDVIHTNGFNAAFIGKFLSRIFQKRSVMSTCAIYNLKPQALFSKIIKWVLCDYDRILALGELSKKELVSIGLDEGKIRTYSLWVDQNKYIPRDKKEAKSAIKLNGRFLVLYIGRFIKIKGVETLIEVAKLLDKNITFVFIGDDGPCLSLVEKSAWQFNNIILVKGIRAAQLIPYYQAADIFVMPSQYQEAFGKVIIEALSCGTLVIGSDRGAIPCIVTSSVGRIVEPTVESIKREIEYLYFHPDILKQLTKNCRAYAEQSFGEKNIEVIINAYNAQNSLKNSI